MSGQIGPALAAVMAEVDAIGKNRRNEQQRYTFRGIDDFANMLHPVLAKHGVVLRPRVQSVTHLDSYETRGGATMFRVSVTLDVAFVAQDGSEHVARTVGEGCDTGDKATNKAMSAALKYALLMTFLVPTEERELRDSEEDHHEAVRPVEHGLAERRALAARAMKLPGSPARAAVIRDLANPNMPPEQFADATEWVVQREAELAELRRQGEPLRKSPEPTAGAAPSPTSQSPASLASPAPVSPAGAGGVGSRLPEQEEAEVEAAVERAKARAALTAQKAAEGSLRAQLEIAQQQGAAPPPEPIPDPGAQPVRSRQQRGKAVTPEAVAEAMQLPPVGPVGSTRRLEEITGSEDGGW